MERITITEDMHIKAEVLASNMPAYKLSYRGAEANPVGCLGETVAEEWLKRNGIVFYDERNETTHDYRLADRNLTFDVKTKDRTVPLRPNYECTVPLYNHDHQQPTYYLFISLQRDKSNKTDDIRRFHTAYIAGGLNQEQLKSRSRFYPEGVTDPSNDMTIKLSCLNTYASQVESPAVVIERWKELQLA